MEFSLNTIGLFPKMPLEEAVQAGLSHGYRTFELWAVSKEQIAEMARLEKAYGIRFSTVCTRYFDLVTPENRKKYLTALEEVMQDLAACSCRTLITQVGMDNGRPQEEQHASIAEGLKAAAPLLAKYGFVLLVEPLNTVKDHIGYYLHDSGEGFDLIREVDSPHVRLLFDVYHQLQMGEDVICRITRNAELIAHFHIAAIPHRDEKLWQNVDYAPILTAIKDCRIPAPVGVELFPKTLEDSHRVLEELKQFE